MDRSGVQMQKQRIRIAIWAVDDVCGKAVCISKMP